MSPLACAMYPFSRIASSTSRGFVAPSTLLYTHIIASNDEKAIDGIDGSGSRKPTPFDVLLNASNISLSGEVTLNFCGSGTKLYN